METDLMEQGDLQHGDGARARQRSLFLGCCNLSIKQSPWSLLKATEAVVHADRLTKVCE